jgi:hypothetical protein
MTFLQELLRRLFPTSRTEVRLRPEGGIEARVRYSDMDWAELTAEPTSAARQVARDLTPRRRARRRLHWGKRH